MSESCSWCFEPSADGDHSLCPTEYVVASVLYRPGGAVTVDLTDRQVDRDLLWLDAVALQVAQDA